MSPPLPTTPLQKIIHLLDHWDEIHDPNTSSPFGRPGTGTNTPHLPGMSHHPSVIELGRCLGQLKLEQPLWHDHLKAYHLAPWRTTRRPKMVMHKGKTRQIAKPDPGNEAHWERRRVHGKPQWVQMGYVRSGQVRLVELFQGQIFIPAELWDALTLSSDEIEAKARRRRKIAA